MAYQYPQGVWGIVFFWILFAIITPFVAIRLYVQLWFRARPWREIFVVSAWLLYLGVTICFSLQNDWDYYNPVLNTPISTTEEAIEAEMMPITKTEYAQGLMYKPGLFACKAALLCFYMDLTPYYVYRKTWWSIAVSWFFVAAGAAFHILYNFFDCWPYSMQFSWFGNACAFQLPLVATSWALHVWTDLLVAGIPFIILRNLNNLTRKQRRDAGFMFATGFINVFSCAVLLVQFVKSGPDPWAPFAAFAYFMIPLQQASAIILVCLPQAFRFFRGMSAEKLNPNLQKQMEDIESGNGGTGNGNSSKDGSVVVVASTEVSSGGGGSVDGDRVSAELPEKVLSKGSF